LGSGFTLAGEGAALAAVLVGPLVGALALPFAPGFALGAGLLPLLEGFTFAFAAGFFLSFAFAGFVFLAIAPSLPTLEGAARVALGSEKLLPRLAGNREECIT
jgi:hypothetical protein